MTRPRRAYFAFIFQHSLLPRQKSDTEYIYRSRRTWEKANNQHSKWPTSVAVERHPSWPAKEMKTFQQKFHHNGRNVKLTDVASPPRITLFSSTHSLKKKSTRKWTDVWWCHATFFSHSRKTFTLADYLINSSKYRHQTRSCCVLILVDPSGPQSPNCSPNRVTLRFNGMIIAAKTFTNCWLL